jgi:hypothetical protein
MGLAERRLAGMEVERGREAFQRSFAMIIIGFFDRFSPTQPHGWLAWLSSTRFAAENPFRATGLAGR